MTLQNEISELLSKMANSIPAETAKIMAAAIEKIQHSGVVESALREGDGAPEFELANVFGHTISSQDLLINGPLVVSFYRGVW